MKDSNNTFNQEVINKIGDKASKIKEALEANQSNVSRRYNMFEEFFAVVGQPEK